MMRLFLIGACVVCVLTLTSVAGAGMLTYEHLDDNNPTTEGWTLIGTGSAGSADAGPPLNWKIDPGTRTACRYYVDPTADDFADPLGWTSTMLMKFTEGGVNQIWSTLKTGSWYVGWGWDDDVSGYPDIIINGLSSGQVRLGNTYDPTDGFHYYQMIYDPTADVVTWYFDGTSVCSAATSELKAHTARNYYFGDVDSSTGSLPTESQYALVRLESGQHVIPEPSTAVLLVLGGVLLGVLRFRRK
jgi:hypothetical protein